MSDLLEALQSRVAGEVRVDPVTRGLYATDASHYQMMPAAVVTPRDERDVAGVVEVARQLNVPITGRGGGTSLAGQTFGPGIVVDFSRYMHEVLEVNEAERWARVQPGIVRDHLNKHLLPMKLHFAPDPATSSRATVGGMISNNSSGTRSIVYGKTIDNVLALKVMLSDGTVCDFEPCDPGAWSDKSAGGSREAELYRGVWRIVQDNRDEIARRFPKVMRRVGGYNLDEFILSDTWNLSKLICGSEGTLGLVLEAKVKLTPLPGATALCIVHFHDLIDSLRDVPAMLTHNPSTVELLDTFIIREARVNPATRDFASFFEGDPQAVQIVEFMGDTPPEADERARRFAADMQSRGIGFGHVLRHEPRLIQHVWELRRLGVGLQSNVKGRRKPLDFVDDACVPVDKLATYIERLRDYCHSLGVQMPISAHASVGVLHPKPLLDLHEPGDRELMRKIADFAFAMVKEYGGSWAGEHGDGLVRGEYLRPFFGDQLYEAFRRVKHLFDPHNLMNPGKILDTPSMTENLRHGSPSYEHRVAEVKANYHYREQGGFALAVEQCSGIGACRKIGSGTMCPSYMATRDEDASTRGRANALRLAMSGQLGEEGLADDGVAGVLDLCLSCKSCKSECPNMVDMAKLKSDVLQMRFDKYGTPIAARLMASAPDAARRIAGPLARLVNAAQTTAPYKWAVEKVMGIDRRRPLPAFATRRLSSMLRKRAKPRAAASRGKVVLFDDTFANYHEPEIGLAAVELLEGCGFEVIVAKAGCCQRPRLSKGLVREAKRLGEKTLRNLLPYAEQGLPIVFTEPSCASAIGDDLADLVDDAELGRVVSQSVMMIDAFLAQYDDLPLRATVPEVLIHGHCHQKALYGTKGMHRVFENIHDLLVTEVDSGCCGMAGSFGYEHYDLSLKIGEQRLFPAARLASQRGAAVCANGFSCRHQLRDACGVDARHFVQLVAPK